MKIQNRPYVFLDFDMAEGHFDLAIANIGNRVAHNVKFLVIRDIENSRGEKLSEKSIIKDGISYFPPQRRFLFSFDFARSFLKKTDEDLFLHFKVEYFDGNRYYEDEFKYDLSIYKGMYFRSFSDVGAVVSSGLKEISRTLDKGLLKRHDITQYIGKKWCPICGESINSKAKKCHYCGEWIKEEEKSSENEQIDRV